MKLARKMFRALQMEEANGGFAECPQFAEEGLDALLDHLDATGLKLLMKKIEQASRKGLTRKSKILNEFGGERGVW